MKHYFNIFKKYYKSILLTAITLVVMAVSHFMVYPQDETALSIAKMERKMDKAEEECICGLCRESESTNINIIRKR